ncbi:DUF4231 domain-containing protein [Microvirga sesbaniae]|uniref:DUF4231 domain-containing protein n=1 Tax=Microvirga sesbaniae TaxID=681392 RepID=UPI00358DC7ED
MPANGVVALPLNEQEWKSQEDRLLHNVRSDIEYYDKASKVARIWHRSCGIVAIFAAALAPLFVLGSGQSSTVFGISTSVAGQYALFLTVITAIVEGLRRFFRFENRWRATCNARAALECALDDYNEVRYGLNANAQERVAAYRKLRNERQRITRAETEEFFGTLVAPPAQQASGP